jgi:hypothetical protein
VPSTSDANSNPGRNAKYPTSAQLCQAFSPKITHSIPRRPNINIPNPLDNMNEFEVTQNSWEVLPKSRNNWGGDLPEIIAEMLRTLDLMPLV